MFDLVRFFVYSEGCLKSPWSIFRITFAGFPATTTFSGTSLVTTEPAPTTEPFKKKKKTILIYLLNFQN